MIDFTQRKETIALKRLKEREDCLKFTAGNSNFEIHLGRLLGPLVPTCLMGV